MSVKFQLAWVVAGLALYFTFAFFAGIRHERDQAVKRDNITLTRELSNARAAAKELHEMALSIQAEHIASVERLNAIARDFEVSREQYQTHFTRQRAALSRLLEKRPDLDVPAGVDVVRHWTASNTGPGLDAAAGVSPAADPGQPDAAVSDPAAAGREYMGASDCEPRCGDGALPPVPGDAAALDRSDEGMGTERAEALLRANQTHGTNGGGVP